MKFRYVNFDSDNDDEVIISGSKENVKRIVRKIVDDIRCGVFEDDEGNIEGVCYRRFDGNWNSEGKLVWEKFGEDKKRNFVIKF